jgi:outer membrane protein TolC
MRGDDLVAAAQKHLERMNRSLDLVKSKHGSGTASEADVATAEGAVAEADFFLAQAKDAH